ncbi:hypothetical protein M0R45_015494 [Rubus argutus]|uniref:Disease resistance protein RPM1-like n=1 Tax=Rubus argutus TaxID=59490 RepID=A0AAW1XRU5_RUBAR
MASAATDLLIAKIVGILENEASSIAGVRDQVNEITQELESMKAFLEDAEGNTSHTKVEEAWVARVRDLTYDVEDIIDEFMYHIYEQKSRGGKTIKLQNITRTIQAIPERNQRYATGAGGRTSTSHHDVRKWVQKSESSLLIKEDELVGIESKKQLLMGWLMKEEQSQIVVSVVGMGGSGKTTLVAKTFTNEIVKRHFDCCAWITVSQTFVIEDLFKKLIKEFYKAKEGNVLADMNAMSCRELQEILINYLESKRYLLVLDDVWDITLWEQIRLSFPESLSGSRIMLTTRNEDIASCSFGAESHVYRIQPLQEKEAWDLFSKKAFSTYHNKSCPPELETLAWKLVKKCKGLPLAVVALAGLMSSKKSPDQWSIVYNNLNWHLSNNPLLEDVKSILLLSFNDLPYRLKHCFLYCSLFPEDYLINTTRLTRLWMAEGFVEHVKGVTPEEVADGYLTELIFRSMLQVVYANGAKRYCTMHDLMLELALSTSEKDKFCAAYDGRVSTEERRVRHLSIQTTEGEIKVCTGMAQLRAFLLFVRGTFSLSLLKTFSSSFKFLRVLDLDRVPIEKCPDELVYLFNLRYLNLSRTQLKELPESIGRLRNLQTLDLRETKIEALPRGIVKLLNLRHLNIFRHNGDPYILRVGEGMKTPLKISKLKKLQVVSGIESEGNFIKLVKEMTQLTSLSMTNVKGRDERDLCISLQEMKLLTGLGLYVKNEEEFIRVDALSSPPPQLQRLTLAGKLESVPRWFCSLYSLKYLHLRWTLLEEDLLPHIEALPNLDWLWLVNACALEKLCFSSGFVKLTHLELLNFPLLEEITIEQGVMPNLQFLRFDRCTELKTIPEGFEYLTQLETFYFDHASEEFYKSIEGGGVNHSKFRQRFPNMRM